MVQGTARPALKTMLVRSALPMCTSMPADNVMFQRTALLVDTSGPGSLPSGVNGTSNPREARVQRLGKSAIPILRRPRYLPSVLHDLQSRKVTDRNQSEGQDQGYP